VDISDEIKKEDVYKIMGKVWKNLEYPAAKWCTMT
jgi:hypothetical protein